MTKATHMKAELKKLDDVLIAGSSQGGSIPVAKKAIDGSDRIGGYPPA